MVPGSCPCEDSCSEIRTSNDVAAADAAGVACAAGVAGAAAGVAGVAGVAVAAADAGGGGVVDGYQLALAYLMVRCSHSLNS